MLFFIVCLIILTFLLVNGVYRNSNLYYKKYPYVKRLKESPYDLDIVNLGSGPSLFDFSWEQIDDVKGYNMAIWPEDFRYDSRILKYYSDHLKKGAIVVVVVCPLSFGENMYLKDRSFSDRYVRVLPRDMVDTTGIRYYLKKYFPLIFDVRAWIVSHCVKVVDTDVRKGKKISKKKEVDTLVCGWLSDNPGLNDLRDASQAKNFTEVFKRKKKELQDVIEEAKRLELNPIIVIPPVSKYLREYMSEEFIDEFVLKNLDEFRSVCPILDYHNDSKYSDLSNYTNGLFLNKAESKVFTKEIVNMIYRQK